MSLGRVLGTSGILKGLKIEKNENIILSKSEHFLREIFQIILTLLHS